MAAEYDGYDDEIFRASDINGNRSHEGDNFNGNEGRHDGDESQRLIDHNTMVTMAKYFEQVTLKEIDLTRETISTATMASTMMTQGIGGNVNTHTRKYHTTQMTVTATIWTMIGTNEKMMLT